MRPTVIKLLVLHRLVQQQVLFLMAGAFGIIWFVGSTNYWLDLLSIGIGGVFGSFAASMCVKHRLGGWLSKMLLTGLVFLLSWLSLLTLADWTRTNSILHPQPRTQRIQSSRVGLALSGGGYRAALFHAGVVSVLQQEININAISSVSGGSIFGAFYALGGSPDDFLSAVKQHRFNLKREIIHIDNLIRLIIPGYDRTHVQAGMLNRLFAGSKVFREVKTEPIALMICTTDLSGAQMYGITPRGAVMRWLLSWVRRTTFVNPTNNLGNDPISPSAPPFFYTNQDWSLPGDLDLGEVVAASGAFPGALPPYLVRTNVDINSFTHERQQYLLADGGLADNSGLVLLEAAVEIARLEKQSVADGNTKVLNLPEWDLDFAIASDGSALSPRDPPQGGLSELARAIDLIHSATGGEVKLNRIDQQRQELPKILISPVTFMRIFKASDLKKPEHLERIVDLYRGDENAVQPLNEGDLPRQLSFRNLDEGTLHFMIAHMPSSDRSAAESNLQAAIARSAYRDGKWLNTADPSEVKLFELVRREIFRRTVPFIHTSTLSDQIGKDEADSIFLLGQYMARWNLPYVRRELQRARSIVAPN